MNIGRFYILLVVALSSCSSYPKLSREEQWAHFEDWDLNDDARLDASEFAKGYAESDFFRAWAGRRNTISNDALVDKLQSATDRMKNSIAASLGRDTVASNKGDTQAHQSNEILPAFVERADNNDDGSTSEQEWARVMQQLADENADLVISPLEFYRWQLLRS